MRSIRTFLRRDAVFLDSPRMTFVDISKDPGVLLAAYSEGANGFASTIPPLRNSNKMTNGCTYVQYGGERSVGRLLTRRAPGLAQASARSLLRVSDARRRHSPARLISMNVH